MSDKIISKPNNLISVSSYKSDEIPGKLYKIMTLVKDKRNETDEPLVQETLTLVDVKGLDS